MNVNLVQCERCNAMFKFYCYDCILPVGNITDLIPHVPLPVSCDMYVVYSYALVLLLLF